MAANSDQNKTNPYDEQMLTTLQNNVLAQSKSGSYDFDVNRTLLKIYQVYPEKANSEITANILALALMRLPHTDYVSLSFLVPVRLINNPQVALVQNAAELLQEGKFVQFWELVEDSNSAIAIFQQNIFRKAIRNFIFGCIKNTFRDMRKDDFYALLDLNENESDLMEFPFSVVSHTIQTMLHLFTPFVGTRGDCDIIDFR